MISVIMPVRNGEATIHSAVATTLRALGSNDELLVGLHNSQDGSKSILEAFTDDRLKILRVPDVSFGEALNYLVSQSTKPFLARMDADDICLPWRFILQRRLIEKRPNSFLFSSVIVFRKNGLSSFIFPQHPIRMNSSVVKKSLEENNPLNHPTFFTRRETFDLLAGYRSIPGEDLDLWLRACLNGVLIERSAIPTVLYRLSGSQLSREKAYSQGWRTSPEISELRIRLKAMNATQELELSLGERLVFSAVKLGLPTPRKLLQRALRRNEPQ